MSPRGARALPWAAGAVLAGPGMDSEGWFAVSGWKYFVKWHHSGSYQLYPGKIPRQSVTLSWLSGQADMHFPGMLTGAGTAGVPEW